MYKETLSLQCKSRLKRLNAYFFEPRNPTVLSSQVQGDRLLGDVWPAASNAPFVAVLAFSRRDLRGSRESLLHMSTYYKAINFVLMRPSPQ